MKKTGGCSGFLKKACCLHVYCIERVLLGSD